MKTLLFAAILYLSGIVIILLLRPSLMFDEDGQWKEFGTLSKDHTIFPFWLFCISWAAISYCVTLIFINESPVMTGAAAAAALRQTGLPEDLVHPLPPKKKSKAQATKPGYYMLDSKDLKKSGIPKYIYVGGDDSPPIAVDHEDSDDE